MKSGVSHGKRNPGHGQEIRPSQEKRSITWRRAKRKEKEKDHGATGQKEAERAKEKEKERAKEKARASQVKSTREKEHKDHHGGRKQGSATIVKDGVTSQEIVSNPKKTRAKGKGTLDELQMPGPESLLSLGNSIAEITREIKVEEIAVPARSAHDMRSDCNCCRRKKSRVKSLRHLVVQHEIATRNSFEPLEEVEEEPINEIMCITKDQDQIAHVREDDQW